jgi:hypothetical protein
MTCSIVRLCLYVLPVVLFTACLLEDDDHPDQSLCSGRTPNTSNALRIHGFYYRAYDISTIPQYDVICLFRNGILLDLGRLSQGEWDNLDDYLEDNFYFEDGDRSKLDWGIYHLTDTTISYQKWYLGEEQLLVFQMDGNLLNDSTFHIIDRHPCYDDNHSTRDLIYNFLPFQLRPDSTTTRIH